MRTTFGLMLGATLLCVVCTACVPVPIVAAAAATGGYLIGKDERSLEQISTDGRITAEVKTALLRDPDVRALQIDVDTYEGIVTLKGVVQSETERVHAGRIASRVKGVSEVRLDLKIVPVVVEERS